VCKVQCMHVCVNVCVRVCVCVNVCVCARGGELWVRMGVWVLAHEGVYVDVYRPCSIKVFGSYLQQIDRIILKEHLHVHKARRVHVLFSMSAWQN